MTVAELFVRLGFKIEGKDDFDKTVKGLTEATVQAVKAAAGVDLVAAAIIGMVTTAVSAGVAMQKFAISTGLSRSELQQWEHTAALANVSVGELQAGVKGIQTLSQQIQFGQGNTQPWALLGINPHSNPFVVLRQLNAELQSLDPSRVAAARYIATQAGISENMFQMLRQKNLPIDSLKQMYLMTGDNQQNLIKLNVTWQNFLDTSQRLKNIFAAQLAPAFTIFVDILQKGVDLMARFVQWMDSGDYSGLVLKYTLGFVAVALTAIAAAFTIATTALGLFTASMIAFQIAAAIPLGIILAIATAAGVAALAIATLASAFSHLHDTKTASQLAQQEDLREAGVIPWGRASLRNRAGWQSFGESPGVLASNAGNSVNVGGITLHMQVVPGIDGTDLGRTLASELKKQLDIATWTRGATAR